MIETRRLKNVVIFVQTILSFVLSRKIIPISFTVSLFEIVLSEIRKFSGVSGLINKWYLPAEAKTKFDDKPFGKYCSICGMNH